VLVAAGVVVFAARQHSDRRSFDHDDAMNQWEYLVVQGGTVNLEASGSSSMRKAPPAFSREAFPLEQNLDKLGKQGWELVQVTGNPADPAFFFKRRR
jgi:hypothetical protein